MSETCRAAAVFVIAPRFTPYSAMPLPTPPRAILLVIPYSVFRLAARRTVLCGWFPRVECAPVSEKRVGLNRFPRRQGYGR